MDKRDAASMPGSVAESKTTASPVPDDVSGLASVHSLTSEGESESESGSEVSESESGSGSDGVSLLGSELGSHEVLLHVNAIV